MTSCHRVYQALQDCQRRYPRDHEAVCQHLTSKAGWCLFAGICPKEVRDLEDCVGTTNATQIGVHVPTRCEHKAETLSACIEGYRAAAERRTNECPSGKKKQAGPAPAGPQPPQPAAV
ncbi:hypothetical protein HYH03_009672 [Edaphochlamys debaryana]|uniref:Uncharacterized protein n=1 Tax=Edaphochlamys debaryana TaxID=47281 RepID=A0A835XY49_9CHLO|nr:hypothetical protein HYH03_009672 [Edaphochlamys debaryana]|eukprot:KAG2491939.1 hypothetical protein HYH03_009672 [Edaphochlamys debaryana]